MQTQQNILTVSQLNFYIKSLLNEDYRLKSILLKGEISNLKLHQSGHIYFSLKDTESAIKAVMFKGNASRLKFVPENGMKVILSGKIDVFERDGTYQLYVSDIIPDGKGKEALALEQLKQKLYSEGLFDEKNKKQIPFLPKKIGVVVGENSAAMHDIITVLEKKYPIGEIILFPVKVQGKDADIYISFAIEFLDKNNLCDVIICGRGGGSKEDLNAFNSETLARYAFNCKTPIISAIGHEIDYSILDLVASKRAHTPTDAANIIASQLEDYKSKNLLLKSRLSELINKKVVKKESEIETIKQKSVFKGKDGFNVILNLFSSKSDDKKRRIIKKINSIIEKKLDKNITLCEKLSILSPLNTLKRGYAIALFNNKSVNENEISNGDEIKIYFERKTIIAEVKQIEKPLCL